MKWLKKKIPSVYNFIMNFFGALNNKKEGHSLKKWLAIGFFWLSAVCVYEYTNADNVSTVLAILTAMITTLIITNSASNYANDKLDKLPNQENNVEVTDDKK